ncbi:DUF4267 domain-containing protein [Streptomyces sp. NBC_00249]|uniref:DUF4267 domain-containing protein n=1 Tax=Streptomyces sp. NBC_00249 TaxID=2975690 RepID=UPI00224EB3D4|nr:DUF4267 domain-containing protein [Streptomyces sp. NBC_00249]MCX5199375.1 DUF4267 domain-containing protein [Streptomyces sp. NBC_00249]
MGPRFIGLSYLLAPQATAPDFGIPTWPQHDGAAFLAVKGVRDIATGLVVLALLLTGHRRALGWAMAAIAFVPAGDMVIVLTSGGPAGTAYGVHGFTALAVAVTAGLLLRERPSATTRTATASPATSNPNSRAAERQVRPHEVA